MRIVLKCFIWLFASVVLVRAIWLGLDNQLGPDPGKALTDELGLWGLRFLLATLCMRPLFEITNQPLFLQVRRLLGLFSWFFASIHLAAGLFYVIGLSFPELSKAVSEKTYVLLGVLAWVLLFPLAVTSNRLARRKLRQGWIRLHRLVYPAAIFACLHFLWLTRADFLEPVLYCVFLLALLAWRLLSLRNYRERRALL